MKFTIDIEEDLSLARLKRVFFATQGMRQAIYNLKIDDVMVHVVIQSVDDYEPQQVTIGLFDITKDIKASYTQVYPLRDIRFQIIDLVNQIFDNPDYCWGYLECKNPEETFQTIKQLLTDIHRINNLKAFL